MFGRQINRTYPWIRFDEEEMTFLCRRCCSIQLLPRTDDAAQLAESFTERHRVCEPDGVLDVQRTARLALATIRARGK